MDSLPMLCPCNSGHCYSDCCQPYHDKLIMPPTALILMKSRYTAYALGLVEYVMDSTHRQHPDYDSNRKRWRQQLINYCQNTQFKGLAIITDEPGEIEAFVTFHASLAPHGKAFDLKERSHFVRLNQRWLYRSGEIM